MLEEEVRKVFMDTHKGILEATQARLTSLVTEAQEKLSSILQNYDKAAEILGTKSGLLGLLEIEQRGGAVLHVPENGQRARLSNETLTANTIIRDLMSSVYFGDAHPTMPNYNPKTRKWVEYDMLIVLLPKDTTRGS